MSTMNRRSFLALSAASASMLAACGGGSGSAGGGEVDTSVDPADLTFPLAETATITGLTNYPVGSEPEPNNRTIFKRLEEETVTRSPSRCPTRAPFPTWSSTPALATPSF